MFLLSIFLTNVFLGGYSFFFWSFINLLTYVVKVLFISALFVILRASLPRYRYDQLMLIGWETILPLGLGYMLFFVGIIFYFGAELVKADALFMIT